MANYTVCKQYALDCIRAGLVPYFAGAPGIGKTALSHDVANELKLQLIDINVPGRESIDITGYPDKENGRAKYVPFEEFPIHTDKIPAGKAGWLIMLDEIPQADPSMQKALMRLIHERKVGHTPLHPACHIMGAGNRVQDNSGASVLLSALGSRICQMTMESDANAWLLWATNKLHYSYIPAFIKYKPDFLNTFNEEENEGEPYACERQWHKLDNLCSVWVSQNDSVDDKIVQMAGLIGEPSAIEFSNFLMYQSQLPNIEDIIKSPMTVPVPNNPAISWACLAGLAMKADDKNITELMLYVSRFTIDSQFLFVQLVLARSPALLITPSINAFTSQYGNILYGRT